LSRHEDHDGRCTDVAVTPERVAELHFGEELEIFRIMTNRIQRAAVELDMTGVNAHIAMPDIEKDAAAEVGGPDDVLADAWIDLDEIADKDARGLPRERTDAVSRAIARWREELAAA
jgi:hypothetical protein